jgi:PmbA protein
VSLADDLAARLGDGPECDGSRVVGWGFELGEGEAVRAGLKNGALGGPYEPPGLLLGVGGSLDLRWSDGLRTLGTIDRQVVERFAERLAGWRMAAFYDRWAAPIERPGPCPDVATADPRVEPLLGPDPAPLFRLLGRARTTLAAHGVEQVDASVGAGRGWRRIRNSAGLSVEFPETSFALHLSADELYSETFSKRRLADEEEVETLFESVARTTIALRREESLPGRDLPVLFVPKVLEGFLGRFLGSNLGARSVVDRHSAFRLEDFAARRPVVREDVDVLVDTTLPLELAASPCSAEGVPGGRVALIDSGRLATPMADLKQARRGGFQPTPAPRGSPSLLLGTAAAPLDLEAALAKLDPGLVVYFVMGVHTQNARTSEYSVAAPQAQVVRAGVRGGKTAVRLAGNFLSQLRDPSSILVRFPGRHNPGLLVHCEVRASE